MQDNSQAHSFSCMTISHFLSFNSRPGLPHQHFQLVTFLTEKIEAISRELRETPVITPKPGSPRPPPSLLLLRSNQGQHLLLRLYPGPLPHPSQQHKHMPDFSDPKSKQQTNPLLTLLTLPATIPFLFYPLGQNSSGELPDLLSSALFCNSSLTLCSHTFDPSPYSQLSLLRSSNDHHAGKSKGPFLVSVLLCTLIVSLPLKHFPHSAAEALLILHLLYWPLFSLLCQFHLD